MAKRLTKAQWRRRKRLKKRIFSVVTILFIMTMLAFPAFVVSKPIWNRFLPNNVGKDNIEQTLSDGKIVQVKYLTPNAYSRPQKKLRRINGVVIHYTANPGSTAQNNQNYFEGLAESHITHASSHYIIGLEGEVIQCIPLTEISYASNDRNDDTVSIECCHPDKSGKFNKKTYESLVSLVAALCIEFNLEERDIIRHYDVTGKLCPLYYVKHEEAWEKLKEDVMDEVEKIRSDSSEK